MENTINKLKAVNTILYEKYGSDSYGERCLIHDAITEIEALILPVVGITFKDKQINRFEVIDKIGRAYVNVCDRPLKIEASLQDDDRTLKIFLDD